MPYGITQCYLPPNTNGHTLHTRFKKKTFKLFGSLYSNDTIRKWFIHKTVYVAEVSVLTKGQMELIQRKPQRKSLDTATLENK